MFYRSSLKHNFNSVRRSFTTVDYCSTCSCCGRYLQWNNTICIYISEISKINTYSVFKNLRSAPTSYSFVNSGFKFRLLSVLATEYPGRPMNGKVIPSVNPSVKHLCHKHCISYTDLHPLQSGRSYSYFTIIHDFY